MNKDRSISKIYVGNRRRMEYDMESSASYPMISESIHFKSQSPSDSSSDEISCSYPRNQRKKFWKGDCADTMNKVLISRTHPKRKIHHYSKKEKKETCAIVKKKLRDIRNTAQNKHVTIKLSNVPVKMNNILDLYHRFSRFGTITLIQVQRNNNPFCAILSYHTSEAAKKAKENAKRIISNVKAAWFEDICLLTTSDADYIYDVYSSEDTCNDITDLPDGISCTERLYKGNDEHTSGYDMKYEQNLEILITDLIQKKNKLLSHQMDSMREIIQKVNKCKIGSNEEKILLELLKKVQDQVYENRKSIEYSIQQRTEYYAKNEKSTSSKPVEKITSNCPPWITAFQIATTKRNEIKFQHKHHKKIFQSPTSNVDNRSPVYSEKGYTDNSEESPSRPFPLNLCKTAVRKPIKRIHPAVNIVQDENYEYELDYLLSDDSDVQEID